MIAGRHLALLSSLLGLACVPTVLHSYVGVTVNDGRSVEAVPRRLSGLDSRPAGRPAAYVMNAYGTTDFIERHYGSSLTLFVARGYDSKRLYHHPELGIAHGDPYERVVVRRSSTRPHIPLFVLESASDKASVYALLHEDQFIEDPIRFQLRNALTLLFRPKSPMTLFFVRSRTASAPLTPNTPTAEALLLAAIDSFVAQPGMPVR
jgi:hypothetical protein